MATITHRVGLGRNLTATEVDANFDALNTAVLAVTPLTVQDEGSPLTTAATTINFVGSGVTATGIGATKTVTILAGGDALTSGTLAQFAPTSSAQLRGVLSDETGTGIAVFSTSPTLITPVLGVASATSINKITITQPATGATLALIDGTTVTGPAATGTLMTLGNAEAVTGAKTYGSGKMIYAGATSGMTILNATAIAGSTTLTLPAATDTLIGKATTDTLTNKTYDTAGGGNSFSVNGVALSANSGTGAMVRVTSPTLVTPNLGVATATTINKITFTAPATGATVAWVDGTTITGPAASGTLLTATTSVSLTGANSLTTALHSNRHLSWTGGVTAAQALPASSLTTGDYIELTNDGTAVVTFTGGSAVSGFKFSCDPGETFTAVYTNSLWKSITPTRFETLAISVGDESTAITTGTAKLTFRMPFAMTVTGVRASLGVVSSSGIPTVNIKESGTTIFSTKLTIDASEKTSTTAATAAVLSDTALADDAEMTIDIDVAGTGAAGLKVYIMGYRA